MESFFIFQIAQMRASAADYAPIGVDDFTKITL
jgi:hypothetical protein